MPIVEMEERNYLLSDLFSTWRTSTADESHFQTDKLV